MSTKNIIDSNKDYNNWFDSSYYHILYDNRDYNEAKEFVKTILKHIKLKKNSKILDAACGKGRHSIEIEKFGYKVTGIDLSKNSIREAKKNENKNLNFLIHDISVPMNEKYDAVFNLFTSFGYHDKKKDLDVLNAIEINLKNNGIGIIDFFNINRVKNELVEKEIIVKKDIKFNITRKVNKNYVSKNITFEDNQTTYDYNESVNALSLKEFEEYFSKTNLEILEVFGDYNLKEFKTNVSPRLIILFQKRSE